MKARKIAALAVAFLFALAIPFAAHADAGPTAQPAPVSTKSKAAAISQGADRVQGNASVNGVGVGVHISIPTASLFQCPASFCNQGVANQHWPTRDDIADICYMPGTTTPWGGNWNLVLNHANNQVGFISTVFIEDAGNGFNFTVC